MYTADNRVLPVENLSLNVITQLASVTATADELNSVKKKTICASLHGAGEGRSSSCTQAVFASLRFLTPLNTKWNVKQRFWMGQELVCVEAVAAIKVLASRWWWKSNRQPILAMRNKNRSNSGKNVSTKWVPNSQPFRFNSVASEGGMRRVNVGWWGRHTANIRNQ